MNADVAELIDRLEALVSAARHVPLSPLVMLDEAAFLDIIDQLRVAVPEEIKQARRVSQEKERVIAHAQAEAEKIIQTAESEAAKMVDESEVVRTAQGRAEAIVAAAEARAQDLRQSTDAYVYDTLKGLDEQLSRLLAQIRRGQALIERPREPGPATAVPEEAE